MGLLNHQLWHRYLPFRLVTWTKTSQRHCRTWKHVKRSELLTHHWSINNYIHPAAWKRRCVKKHMPCTQTICYLSMLTIWSSLQEYTFNNMTIKRQFVVHLRCLSFSWTLRCTVSARKGARTPRAITLIGTQDISGNNCVLYSAHPEEHFGTGLGELWGGCNGCLGTLRTNVDAGEISLL